MKSRIYLGVSLTRVLPNWHRTHSLEGIVKVLHKVEELIKTQAWDLDYKRVYTPKGEGKVRPLGVPTLPWRIYLHM